MVLIGQDCATRSSLPEPCGLGCSVQHNQETGMDSG